MDMAGDAINLAIADFFPFLRPYFRSFPVFGNPVRKRLINLRVFEDKLFLDLLQMAKDKIARGKRYPST